MRALLIGFFLLFQVSLVHAQTNGSADVISATIGVDGLTCSMCSNSVEKLIRKLEFVEDVKMDLNKTEALVIFKPEVPVNFYALASKVVDAGFSVRFIKGHFQFNGLAAENNRFFECRGNQIVFIETGAQVLNGNRQMLFIDKKIINKDNYVRWAPFLREDKKINKTGSNTYHITF